VGAGTAVLCWRRNFFRVWKKNFSIGRDGCVFVCAISFFRVLIRRVEIFSSLLVIVRRTRWFARGTRLSSTKSRKEGIDGNKRKRGRKEKKKQEQF